MEEIDSKVIALEEVTRSSTLQVRKLKKAKHSHAAALGDGGFYGGIYRLKQAYNLRFARRQKPG